MNLMHRTRFGSRNMEHKLSGENYTEPNLRESTYMHDSGDCSAGKTGGCGHKGAFYFAWPTGQSSVGLIKK